MQMNKAHHIARLKDYAVYDSASARTLLGAALLSLGKTGRTLGRHETAFTLLSSLYDSGVSQWSDKYVLEEFAAGLKNGGWLRPVIKQRVARPSTVPRIRDIESKPQKLVGSRLKCVKAWNLQERGALVLDYNYSFPIFVRCFDLAKVASRYQLYIEPSWSGLLNDEVLSLTLFPDSVICAAYEPRDYSAIKSLNTNLVPITLGTNCFIDDRVFNLNETKTKTYDFIMIAAWGRYKCHAAFFKCLSSLRKKKRNLRVALVGYNADLCLAEIKHAAASHGVGDCINYFENIPASDVAQLLRASRINVLWSRREGTGRSPFEGMAAGVPLLLRRGFNYGHNYDYINPTTGRVADESDFVEVADNMLATLGQFTPHEHYESNLSAKVSTSKLKNGLQEIARQNNESFTGNIAIRYSKLAGQEYQNREDEKRFEADHAYLRSCVRQP